MNCAKCIHYVVCPHDAIMHDESRWKTKKCVHFVDESDVKKIDEDVKKLLEEDRSLHLNLDWDGFEARGENNDDM